jgi:hypothetical protein
MRLFVSVNTITLDEYVTSIGEIVPVALGLCIRFLSPPVDARRLSAWACDLSSLGSKGIVQFSEIDATFTAVTGILRGTHSEPQRWQIESVVPIALVDLVKADQNSSIDRVLAGNIEAPCQALGMLGMVGREMSLPGRQFVPVRILRFRSFCLAATDPRFGTWFDVESYAELGSDPDVIAAPVSLAEIELV